ncbi:MAG TPA: response regulator transcription factor [Solirubrobacteraceae bacterium]|nr:response regulator transcription factor [Solirubrobacteraceae bacterium]
MCRVLLVDDHHRYRTVVRELLRASCWKVVGEAWDGCSALAEAQRLSPDVVVLDIGLPDRDGFVVARELAALASPPRVVLVSSTDPADLAVALRASGMPFVPKERISSQTLAAAVECD